jgi:hypothetical protein
LIGIDFEQVQRQVPLKGFIESLGCELRTEGNTYRSQCPLHGEQHGHSLIIYPDGRWFCHGKCAADWPKGGDVIDIAGALWGISDRRSVVERLVEGDVPEISAQSHPRQVISGQSFSPKWPARNLEQIDEIVRDGIGLYDLWELSPIRFDDDENHAEEIIDVTFPGDPLLCVGLAEWRFATRRREVWRGHLARFPLIVPNPMFAPSGLTQAGKQSQHTLDATAARTYLVIECDFARHNNDGTATEFLPLLEQWEADGISTLDACAAVAWHLGEQTRIDGLPLTLFLHSGGKSGHAWFLAYGRNEQDELLPFMRCAHALGADPVTWCLSQFVRIPGGRRQNGRRQNVFYFDPSNAVSL